jgi:dCMP deaminase
LAVHAEANAIAYAARAGVRVEGGQLATTLAPCLNCSMLIINAGISRVIFKERHRDMSGVELLDNGGVEVVKWSV